jgi:hypothetical protein
MVNAAKVNAESAYFRRRLFANLFAFPVEFHDSEIRLNIFTDRGLTVNAQHTDEYYRHISARYVGHVPLTHR